MSETIINQRSNSRLLRFLLPIFGLVAGVLVALFLRNILSPYEFKAGLIDPAEPAPSFELQGTDGKAYTLSDLEDKVTVLYFGYTHCPDFCPATLSDLAEVKRALGADAENFQVFMITTDPARDTLPELKSYMAAFDDQFVGLGSDVDELARVWASYGVYVQQNEGSVSSGYLVDHTSTTYVIDKDGMWRLLIPFDFPTDAIVEDIQFLIRE